MKKKFSSKKLFVLFSLFILILGSGFYLNEKYYQSGESIYRPSPSSKASASPSPDLKIKKSPESTPLPKSYELKDFPFQSQAPLGNWDELHDEACEEAALILVDYYLKDQPVSASTMESQIQKMVSFEIQKFGSHKDLTIEELSEVARDFYNLDNFEIKKNITIDDIKKEIADNHPVIIPTAGRLLGNPYFRQPGPVYHMLVVIGYNGKNIIVQDIGTKRGDHYVYNEKILYNAIHNWNGSASEIESGGKTMLVFSGK